MRSMLAAVVVLGFSGSAFAQVGTPERVIQEPDRVKVRKITNIDLSGIALGGDRSGPSEAYAPVRRDVIFENLIQLRTNFTPELQGSVDNL